MKRSLGLSLFALLAAACGPSRMVDVLRVGAFVGDYHIVALDSSGSAVFTGTLTFTLQSDTSLVASGDLSNWGSVHGEGFVRGDTLHVYLIPQMSLAVVLDGTMTSSVFAGVWTYSADACWVRPCHHGPFTAHRS